MLNFKRQDILAKNKLAKIEFKKSIKENDSIVFVHVGEAPANVSAGLPGARDDVRAYSDRISQEWSNFIDNDLYSFISSKTKKSNSNVSKDGFISSTVDDILNKGAPGLTDSEKDLVIKIHRDRSEFEAYRQSISSFDLTGPSPSEAWQRLIIFETIYKNDRKLLGQVWKLSTKEPGDLENQGGKKETSVSTWIYWVAGGVVVLALVFALAPSINSIVYAGTK